MCGEGSVHLLIDACIVTVLRAQWKTLENYGGCCRLTCPRKCYHSYLALTCGGTTLSIGNGTFSFLHQDYVLLRMKALGGAKEHLI
jgi:hypothetical protein